MIEVENWFGDVYGLIGFVLMECMKEYVECFEIEIIFDYINKVDVIKCFFILIGDLGIYICDVLIIVIGVFVKYLGLEFEINF